MSKYHMLWWI